MMRMRRHACSLTEMPFRYLPHTADVKFEATGPTLQDALGEAARALTHVMTDAVVRAVDSHPVSLSAESKEALFFDFLDHLILLLDTKGLFVSRAELDVSSTGGVWYLSGTLYGDDAANYERHGDVKAPTYHDMLVEQLSDGGWLVRATLDI